MHEVDPQRIVVVVPQPNPAVMRVRPDPSLSSVMGRFTAARYDKRHHAYDMPADLADVFGKFCEYHHMTLVGTTVPEPLATHHGPSRETSQVLAEQRERRADPQGQDETNRKGIALVRLARDLAAKAKARRESEGA